MHIARDVGRRVVGLALALTAAACGGSTATTSVAGPTGVRCQTTVTAQPLVVPSGGGSVQITIASNRDCSWSASSEASWIQLSATAGQGEASIVGSVAGNEQPVSRSGAIVVNDQRLTVSQDPRPCRYELRSSRTRIPHTGGRGNFEIVTDSGCPWTASTGAGWLRVLTPSGTGSAAVEYEASAADGPAREAAITIADLTFTVEQEAAPPPCSFRISPGAGNIEARGGEGRFRVDAPDTCRWSASSGASWASVDGRQRTGSGEVTYSVQTNPTASQRSTTITVSGEGQSASHIVRQGAAARPCTYTVAPAGASFGAAGGQGRFYVSADAACIWSATTGAPWVIVSTGGNYGSGSAEVVYTVLPNTSGASRSTRISVGGQSHDVSQSAATSFAPAVTGHSGVH